MGGCCSSGSDTKGESAPLRGNMDDASDDESVSKSSALDDDIAELRQEWINAVEEQNNTKLKQLFKDHHKKYNFLMTIFENGDNSLHRAVNTHNERLVKFLLILKMDINTPNKRNGNTPLHYAVIESDTKMVGLLVKNKNTNVNISNKKYEKPIDIAVRNSNTKIIDILQSADDGMHDLEKGLNLVSAEGDDGQGYIDGNTLSSMNKPNLGAGNYSHTFGDGTDTGSIHEHDDEASQSGTTYSTDTGNGLLNDTVNIKLSDELDDIILNEFLEKKKHKAPYSWQKRFVTVKIPYMLWDAKESRIEDVTNKEQRKKFHSSIHLSNVKSVTAHKSKSNQFIVTTVIGGTDKKKKEKTKEIEFRCKTEQTRDEWLEGLNKILDALNN